MQKGPALIDGSSERVTGRRYVPEGVAAVGANGPGTRSDVRLTLAAHAAQVPLVRQVVGSLAQSAGLPESRIEDVKLAVTEACTNVVRHAYPDETGSLEVLASSAEDGLTVAVSDHGCGLRPRVHDGPGGLGLPLMAALTDAVEIDNADGQGTTVRLSFAVAE
jgi:serine/threonine-protein kinase RsbW